MQADLSLPNPPKSGNNSTPKLIVTHVAPDFDAIAYAWLMAKYAPGFEDTLITYTPFSNPDLELLNRANSVGDIGGKYDPSKWRFDHHHLEGNESTATCTAKMTWEHLLSLELEIDVAHLEPLIEIVYQGDLGHVDPVGIHGLLWGFGIRAKKGLGQRLSDQEAMAWGFELLDLSATWLKRQVEVKAELAEKVIWKSDDNLVWAVKHGSAGTSFTAYAEGARLVVFEAEPIELDEGISYPVGVSRANEWQSPNIGQLISEILHMADNYDPAVIAEIESWFVHPGGFFAGRGTAKGPMFEKPKTDLITLTTAIDNAWKREVRE